MEFNTITLDDYYMGRKDKFKSEWDPTIEVNALDLLNRVKYLLMYYNKPLEINPDTNTCVSSGWRPPSFNKTVKGAAVRSKHMTGQAIDLYDPEGELDDFLVNNLSHLQTVGLYLEHPSATKGWCHLQSVAPKSQRTVFYP